MSAGGVCSPNLWRGEEIRGDADRCDLRRGRSGVTLPVGSPRAAQAGKLRHGLREEGRGGFSGGCSSSDTPDWCRPASTPLLGPLSCDPKRGSRGIWGTPRSCCWSLSGVAPLCGGVCRGLGVSPGCFAPGHPALGSLGAGGVTDALESPYFFPTPSPDRRIWAVRPPGGFCPTVGKCPRRSPPPSPLPPRGPGGCPGVVPHAVR